MFSKHVFIFKPYNINSFFDQFFLLTYSRILSFFGEKIKKSSKSIHFVQIKNYVKLFEETHLTQNCHE